MRVFNFWKRIYPWGLIPFAVGCAYLAVAAFAFIQSLF